jgi:3,4-dihydroxyphenylacetate 2,3-dioxygenase
MGEIVQVAKITHVPSMFISEQPGPHHGCRDAAISGLRQIGVLAREAGADTFLVLDTHWLVNSGYHINCNPHHKGVYTSNEFPHFIQNISFDYPGDAELGHAIARCATDMGVLTRAHSEVPSLGLEYGTLVPMKYMNADGAMKVVSIAAWMYDAEIDDSRTVGQAILKAIKESDNKVSVLASGSLSHRIWRNRDVEAGLFTNSSPFNEFVDRNVLEMWREGRIADFLDILPDYAIKCSGEGFMHDTVMMFSLLGWDRYQQSGEIVTDYFPSSGTGQCNVLFPPGQATAD